MRAVSDLAAGYAKRLLNRIAPEALLTLRAKKYRKDLHEEELELVPLLAHRDEMAIDVGGNQGFYASFMRHHCSDLIVFEPNPDSAGCLRRGLGPRVSVLQCALSDTGGSVILRLPLANGQDLSGLATIEASNQVKAGTDTRLIEVEAKLLDSLALKNVGFIKIDVEGHELAALRGAKDTLAACKPSLLIEAEDRHRPGAVQSVVDFLAPFGYRGFYFTAQRLHAIESFDPGEHQAASRMGISSGPNKYINNFVFVARPGKMEILKRFLA